MVSTHQSLSLFLSVSFFQAAPRALLAKRVALEPTGGVGGLFNCGTLSFQQTVSPAPLHTATAMLPTGTFTPTHSHMHAVTSPAHISATIYVMFFIASVCVPCWKSSHDARRTSCSCCQPLCCCCLNKRQSGLFIYFPTNPPKPSEWSHHKTCFWKLQEVIIVHQGPLSKKNYDMVTLNIIVQVNNFY